MRICILGSANSIHVKRWVKSLIEFGNEIMVISFYDGHVDNAQNIILPRTAKLLYITHHNAIKRAIRNFKPDILHAHHCSSYGFLGALQSFHPFVISVWGYDVLEFPQKSPLHKSIIKYSLKKADEVTATSQALANSVKELTGMAANIIPFGVDKSFLLVNREYRESELTIGIIKDLKPVYGLNILIEAVSNLINKGNHVKLKILGEGGLKNELQELCKTLKIVEHVIFKEKVPHNLVVDILKEFDIFAITSFSEGFGVAAVEAMATGLPVVASNVGGLPEVVDDGKTGTLVEPGNVEELTKALETYLLSRELRSEHGRNGRAKVESQYNWQENVEMMNQLYKKVIDDFKSNKSLD